jgi:uncharacterized membrane protein
LGVVLLVVTAMLRPGCTGITTKRQTATLVLLLDQSRSMQLPHASGGKSRWETQRNTLQEAEATLRELAEKLEVKVYAFDSQLAPLNLSGGKIQFPAEPDGRQTDIGSPLHDAIRQEVGKRLAGVILLGDGAQTAFDPRVEVQQAGRELAYLGCPLYTVPFGPVGDAAEAKDVAVENLPDQYSVFVKNELLVKGVLRVRGYVNKEIPVELVVENDKGQRETIGPVQLSSREDGQQLAIQMSYFPQTPGQYKLTLKAAQQPGELVTTNNELSAFLTVLEGGLKVLYLEGELRLEQKFLRRSIDASPDIDLDFQWIDSRLRDRWPVNLTDMLSGSQYDVFILGDLDSAALHKEPVNDQNLKAISEAVEKGKGLIMLGGYHSFGPGGYQTTPLADVLPVVMGRFERQDFEGAISTDLHLEGPLQMLPARPHFLTHLAPDAENDQAWRALPPLTGANKFAEVKSRAQVLAETERSTPLLVSGEYGAGRVLAFAGDSTWRWWMQGHDAEHKRFWRQVILWLARRDGLSRDNVWIELAQRRFNPGSRVSFTTGAKTAEGDPIRGASLQAAIVLPDGRRQPLDLAQDGDQLRGSFDATQQAGNYTIDVTASDADQPLGTAEAQFLVFDHDVELSNPSADPDQLARLANLTKDVGGKMVAPEQLSALLQSINERPPDLEIEVLTKWQLADTALDAWLFFMCLIGLLTSEWALRKKWGLV